MEKDIKCIRGRLYHIKYRVVNELGSTTSESVGIYIGQREVTSSGYGIQESCAISLYFMELASTDIIIHSPQGFKNYSTITEIPLTDLPLHINLPHKAPQLDAYLKGDKVKLPKWRRNQ